MTGSSIQDTSIQEKTPFNIFITHLCTLIPYMRFKVCLDLLLFFHLCAKELGVGHNDVIRVWHHNCDIRAHDPNYVVCTLYVLWVYNGFYNLGPFFGKALQNISYSTIWWLTITKQANKQVISVLNCWRFIWFILVGLCLFLVWSYFDCFCNANWKDIYFGKLATGHG